MEKPEDRDEMYSKLKRNRERILILLYRHGDLRSRDLRNQVGLSRGSKNHHVSVLEEWGLITITGKNDETSGAHPERVFGLTDDGEVFVEEYLTKADDERPDSYEMRLERAEDEITDLESTVEQQRREIEELRESKLDESRFEELKDRLSSQYLDRVVERATQQLTDG